MKITKYTLFIWIAYIIIGCNGRRNENKRIMILESYEGVKSNQAKEYLISGDQEHKNKNYDIALQYFEKANKVEPNNPLIINSLANIECALGRKKTAYSHFKKAISLDTAYLISYASYGTCLEKNKEHLMAIDILKRGFQKSSKDQFIHYGLAFNLAINYYKIDNCELADYYVKIALKNKFKNEHFDNETIKIAQIISNCKTKRE